MSNAGLIELVLVFGAVLALAIVDLVVMKRGSSSASAKSVSASDPRPRQKPARRASPKPSGAKEPGPPRVKRTPKSSLP